MMYTFRAVVVYCHSKLSIMARFLFHAQDRDMTNGDFAYFTFAPVREALTDHPWAFYVNDPNDLPRRRRAFYAVKQVRIVGRPRNVCSRKGGAGVRASSSRAPRTE